MKKRMLLISMLIMSMTLPVLAESVEVGGGYDAGADAGWSGGNDGGWDSGNDGGWDSGNDGGWDGGNDESWGGGSSDSGESWGGESGDVSDGGSDDGWSGGNDGGWDTGNDGGWDGGNDGGWNGGSGSESGPSAGDITVDENGHHWYYDGTQYLPMDGSVDLGFDYEIPEGGQQQPSAPQEPQPPQKPEPPTRPDGPTDAEEGQMRIIEVRGEQFEMFPAGEECDGTIEALGVCLRELTDLDFAFDYEQVEEGLIVKWKDESVIIAGLEDQTPESLGFENEEQLKWFMLDSLQATLRYNLGYANIWYTDAEGENLEIVLSEELPCLGGGFYVTYAPEPAEDAEPVVFEKIEDKEQAELVMKIYIGEMLIRDAQISFKEEGTVGETKAYIFSAGGQDLAVTETGLICDQKDGETEFTPIAPEMPEKQAPAEADAEAEEDAEA